MIHVVHLIQVDPVRLQPFQTAVAVLINLHRRKTAPVRIGFTPLGFPRHCIIHLRSQNDRVASPAPLRQPIADNDLCVPRFAAPAVGVGRIEKIDPQLQGSIHDLEAVFL